jgi:3-hydroxyacyl-[acyl-carrier-protein] dehydratase
MRWIWIDRFVKFEPGKTAQAVKNISLSEEHLHDHFPGYPVMPAALIIEGMAQTAGILVCEASGFKEKVILAKISKAVFDGLAVPGDTLLFTANIEQINEQFAVVAGEVSSSSPSSDGEKRESKHLATIELIFSHLDQNLAGKKFPERQFVLTDIFQSLLRDVLPTGGKRIGAKTNE